MELVEQVKTRAVPAVRAAANSDEAKRLIISLRDLFFAFFACAIALANFLEPAAARLVSKASRSLKTREDAASGAEATVFRGLRCAMTGVDKAAAKASSLKEQYDGPCKTAVRSGTGAFAGAVTWLKEPPQDPVRADRVVEMAPRPMETVRAAAAAPESKALWNAMTQLFWNIYAALVAIVVVLAPAVAALVGRLVAYLDHRRAVAGNLESRALCAVTTASKIAYKSGDAALRVSSSYSGPGSETVRSVAAAYKSLIVWLAEAASATESVTEVSTESRTPPAIPEPPAYVPEIKNELEKKED